MRSHSTVTVALISMLSLTAVYAASPASLATGANHTCAVASFSDVARCWGEGEFYQAGTQPYTNPTTADRLAPGDVVTTPGPSQGYIPSLEAGTLAAGRDHSCAIGLHNEVRCWGSNAYGQCGQTPGGTSPGTSLVSIPAGQPSFATKVVGGRYHTCALVMGDSALRQVWCWGRNSSGQLGNNSTVDSGAPVRVGGIGGEPVDIAAYGDHTCALRVDGQVRCWGNNAQGQLGNGTTTRSLVPVDVKLNSSTVLTGVSSISTGFTYSCAVLASDGKVMCWGDGTSGQLGNGTITSSSYPQYVKYLSGSSQLALTGAQAVTSGYAHGCALLKTGKTKCWGSNAKGQIGDGTAVRRTTAVDVMLPEARVISAGDRHTCAILNNGGLRCWGYGGSGQLGRGSTTDSLTPVTVLY